MDKVEYLQWDGNQLTLHLEDRNILLAKLAEAMIGVEASLHKQGWTTVVSRDEAAEMAIEDFELVTDGNGWLGFSVATPWFSNAPVVAEEFIAGIDLDTAVDILIAAAKVAQVSRIVVGTRAAPNGKHLGLSRVYQAKGLSITTIELTLETP